MTLPTLPSSLSALYCRMVSMDSCLALSMKPQVLMTTMSSVRTSADSCTTGISLPRNWPISTSLSCIFLEQPSVTTLIRGFPVFATLIGFVFIRKSRLLEQGVDKLLFIEQLKVVHFFTHANILHRYLELVGYTDNHASFGGAIEFGKGQCVDVGGLGKLLALLNGILAGRSVEYEQDLMGCTRYDFPHHLLDLRQLVHKGDLVVQPACGVDDGYIVAIGYGRFDGIKRYRSRI